MTVTCSQWGTYRWRGDVHVVPLGDTPAHTWPMCWCHPSAQNVATEDGPAQSIMYSHNAAGRQYQ